MQSTCAVLYCRVWPVWLYHIFPHYFINGTTFGKTLLNIECVFWFSLQLLSEKFLILRRIHQDRYYKYTQVFGYSTRYSCQIFNETWLFSTDFRKILKYENPSSGSWDFPWGQTDMTKLIVAFCNLVKAPKHCWPTVTAFFFFNFSRSGRCGCLVLLFTQNLVNWYNLQSLWLIYVYCEWK
jgi:hypothetical protein